MAKILDSLLGLKLCGRRLDDYQKVRRLVGTWLRGDPGQFRLLAERSIKIVNLGCGDRIVPAFFNVDIQWHAGMNACWDITRPLPVPDHCLDGIFSEHCLEHFSRQDAARILKDCLRMLKPGSGMRVVVPDAEKFARLYVTWLDGKDALLPYASASSRETGYTPLMALNRVFREHGHLYAYDFELLASLFAEAGFAGACRAEYGRGKNALLIADSAYRAPESLYIEAFAPQ